MHETFGAKSSYFIPSELWVEDAVNSSNGILFWVKDELIGSEETIKMGRLKIQ